MMLPTVNWYCKHNLNKNDMSYWISDFNNNNTYNCNPELRLTMAVNGINLIYFIFNVYQVHVVPFTVKYPKTTSSQDVKGLLHSTLDIYKVITFKVK